jgi:hypothetical protein
LLLRSGELGERPCMEPHAEVGKLQHFPTTNLEPRAGQGKTATRHRHEMSTRFPTSLLHVLLDVGKISDG